GSKRGRCGGRGWGRWRTRGSLGVAGGFFGFGVVGAGGGHVLVFLLELVDDALDAVGFVDQAVLFLSEGGDDLVVGFGGLLKGVAAGFDDLFPPGAERFDLLFV